MKKIICILLSLVTVLLSVTVNVGASDGLIDQLENGAVISYLDSTASLSMPSCGSGAGIEVYPKPGESWAFFPTSYSFVMINLRGYSGQSREDGKDVPLDESFFTGLEQSLKNARKSGAVLGIRFRFDALGETNKEPDWDNMVQMFVDIRDSGLFKKYGEVIHYCELGTFGAFGEQWGTRYGDYGYSTELIDLYLQIFPEHVPILLRTGGRITRWANDKLGENYCGQSTINMLTRVKEKYPDKRNGKINYYSQDGKDFSTGNYLWEDISRLGYYNDGYMGTNWDYGTYSNRENETAFLAAQEDNAYGGEFSGDRFLQIYYGNDYTTCWWPKNGIPEMYYTHLSYLHGGYIWGEKSESHSYAGNADTITESELDGYYKSAKTFADRVEYVYEQIGAEKLMGTVTVTEVKGTSSSGDTVVTGYQVNYIAPGFESSVFTEEIAQAVEKKLGKSLDLSEYYGINNKKFVLDHLGYRFVVRSSKMSQTVNAGGKLKIELEIDNTGFSKLIGEESAQIVISNGENKYISTIENVSPTEWKSFEKHTVSAEIDMPEYISAGDWKVYLRISNENMPEWSRAAVPFANEGMYDADLGANLIGKIKVESDFTYSKSEVKEDTRPAGYYPENPEPKEVKENDTFYFFDSPYVFTQSGLYGFSLVFKIDGIAEGSSIKLNKWFCSAGGYYSGHQLHSFNYDFQYRQSDGKTGHGYTFTENGYYIMYCPFYSVGAYSSPSVAGKTSVGALSFNNSSACYKDSSLELNGNNVTITSIALIEGAPDGYSVSFETETNKYEYSGKYGFSNTNGAYAERCQFKRAESVLSMYDGEDITGNEHFEDGIRTECVGWTTKPGDRRCAIGEDYVPLGNEKFYPDRIILTDSFVADERTVEINGGIDSQGVIYSFDGERKATVGESGWRSNISEGANLCGFIIIPSAVISDGKKYTVTSIDDLCTDGITGIIIPSSVTNISARVFEENEEIIIYGYKNSAAEKFAVDNGYEFLLMTEDFDGVFVDIERGDWYYSAVRFAYKNNIMSGMEENVFAPLEKTTRAMFAKILYNIEGKPDMTYYANVFDDVEKNSWYRDAVVWAEEYDIVKGMTKYTFAPNDILTREQLAAMLYRYARYKGEDISYTKDIKDYFSDASKVSDWAYGPFCYAYERGYITGVSETVLSPDTSVTRAQVASAMKRFCS